MTKFIAKKTVDTGGSLGAASFWDEFDTEEELCDYLWRESKYGEIPLDNYEIFKVEGQATPVLHMETKVVPVGVKLVDGHATHYAEVVH